MKKIGHLIYVIVLGVALVAAGSWLTVYLAGALEEPLSLGPRSPQSMDFEDILSQTDLQVRRHLGEWEFSEPKLEGHFHHIGRWYQRDEWNFCIECHGPTPHSRSAQIRAFLNMHSLFVSCEVCHVRSEENERPTRFGWIGLTDGRLSPNPEMEEGIWGEYGVKIIQLIEQAGRLEPLVMTEEREFAAEFNRQSYRLDERQKVIGNKFIHRTCIEEPLQCTRCHTAEDPFLPFSELGYSKERADFLVDPEVVDLVQRYETFIIPSLLQPAETETATVPTTGQE